jgi:hypothetical protein
MPPGLCRAGHDSEHASAESVPAPAAISRWHSALACGCSGESVAWFWASTPYGTQETTPVESLSLQPGESVAVKPRGNISDTLNDKACNRGLRFFPNMRLLFGSRSRVRNRLDKIVMEETGEMRQLRNIVYLDGSICGCAHVAFGDCPRGEFAYWRQIWLHRGVDI